MGGGVFWIKKSHLVVSRKVFELGERTENFYFGERAAFSQSCRVVYPSRGDRGREIGVRIHEVNLKRR